MFGILKSLLGSGSNDPQLETALEKGALLVDVRTPSEFASGSVTGAVNVPLDRIQQQLAFFKNKQHIVVFCRSGNRSYQAKLVLERNGISGVVNGGTWQKVNAALLTKKQTQ